MEINKLRKVEYNFKECLVGQSVSCLMYAYLHDIPVIGIEKYKPLRFNYIDRDVDLSPLGLVNESVVLKTIDSRPDYLVGMEEIKLWHILKIHLSYAGLLPCFGMYSSIDIINDNRISLVIKNRSIEVNSDNFVFYDNFSLPLYEVNDYIDINKNSNVPIDFHDNMEQWNNRMINISYLTKNDNPRKIKSSLIEKIKINFDLKTSSSEE